MEMRLAHLGRLREIAFILIKYGFHDVVDRLDLPFPTFEGRRQAETHGRHTYERIRMALQDLGPSFVKLGQNLSLRPDLIPAGLAMELRALRDQVPPVPSPDILDVVEECLGAPLAELFISFEEQPIAAASLAQVHRAVLLEERAPVAVKIQRPGIQEVVRTDLAIIEDLAAALNGRFEALAPYDLPAIVREIKRGLLREMDFVREARNMTIARADIADWPEVRIPKSYDRYCGERVLTMELLEGRAFDELRADEGKLRRELALLGLRISMRQILEKGFFHADPHPGNYRVLPDGSLALLDWGLVGRMTQRTRFLLIDMISAVMEQDTEKLVNSMLDLARTRGPVDMGALERDALEILEQTVHIPIKDLRLGEILTEASSLMRNHHIHVPPELAIMIKTIITAEGAAREFYPDLNAVKEAEPFVKQLARERFHPRMLWRELRRSLIGFLQLNRGLPERLARLFNKLEQGELNIRLEHQNLRGLIDAMESASNRLSLSIILAAIVIGSSLIITTGAEPLLFGYPALGVIGYVISALLGLWVVFTIIRRRRF